MSEGNRTPPHNSWVHPRRRSKQMEIKQRSHVAVTSIMYVNGNEERYETPNSIRFYSRNTTPTHTENDTDNCVLVEDQSLLLSRTPCSRCASTAFVLMETDRFIIHVLWRQTDLLATSYGDIFTVQGHLEILLRSPDGRGPIDRLSDWLTGRLADWLTDWLAD